MLLCGYLSKLTVSAVKTNMQNICLLIHLKTTIIKWLHVNGRPGLDPWVGKIPRRRERLPTPVFWSGEFHGLYSPGGRKELDFHFHYFITGFPGGAMVKNPPVNAGDRGSIPG